MKSLTAGQETARLAGGRDLFRFVKIEWPDDPTTYYSERAVAGAGWSPDSGITFKPLLRSFPQTSRRVSLGVEETMPSSEVSFGVTVDPTDSDRVDALIENEVPLGIAVTSYEVMRPAAGDAAESDWITLGRYLMLGFKMYYEPMWVQFRCADWLDTIGEKYVGRLITTDLFPLAPSASYGQVIPHVFGTVLGAPLPLVGAAGTQATTLDETIDEEELQIVLADGAALASSGTVIIDGEEIEYSVISGDTMTATLRGANDTVAVSHSFGAAVTQLLNRYTFAVADHPIVGVSNLIINDILVDINTVTRPYVDANGVTLVDLVGTLPEITEPGATTSQIGLTDLESPPLWGEGAENTADSATEGWAQAVDDGDDAHVTFCRLPDGTTGGLPGEEGGGSVLHLKMTNDLSTNNGTIKKAIVGIEYQAVNGDINGWPIDFPPYFYLLHGETVLSQALTLDETGYLEIDSSAHFADSGGVWIENEYIEYGSLNTDVSPPRSVDLTRGANHTKRRPHDAAAKVYHVVKSVGIAAPPDEDIAGNTELYPEEQEGANSTELFDLKSGSLGAVSPYGVLYVGGYAEREENVFSFELPFPFHGTFDLECWRETEGWTGGHTLTGEYPLRSIDVIGFTVGVNLVPNDIIPRLLLKLENPTGTSESVTAKINVSGNPLSDYSSVLAVEMRVICDSHTAYGSVYLAPNDTKNLSVTLTRHGNGFTQSQLESTRISITGSAGQLWSKTDPPYPAWDKAGFYLNSVEAGTQGDYAFVGNDTPLDSSTYISSNRVTQRIDISEDVLATGGWPWFTDDTSLMVAWPDDLSAIDVLVYRLGMDLEVLGGSTRRVRENEVECVADVVGQAAPFRNFELLTRLLTGADYFGLVDGVDYDSANLIAACDDAAASLETGTWDIARRLDRRERLLELMASAVTDSGIRFGMDGGKLVFFPRITGSTASRVRTIDRDEMLSAPEKDAVTMELVWNEIAVYYARKMSGTDRGFQKVEEANNPTSEAKAWGTRRYTYDAEWIRDEMVARTLSQRMTADFSAGRQQIAVTVFSGLNLDLELGDAIGLTDSFSRMIGQVGRIVGASNPSAPNMRLTLAYPISDSRVRVWEHVPSDSFIDAYPIEQTMKFVIGGVEVAQLNVNGLRLAGEVNEVPWAPEDSEAALIVYDGVSSPHAIQFNVFETADTYYRAMALDAVGDLRVSELREKGDYFPLTTVHAFAAYIELATNGEDVLFTTDLAREMMRVENLDVAGEINGELQARQVTENADLI